MPINSFAGYTNHGEVYMLECILCQTKIRTTQGHHLNLEEHSRHCRAFYKNKNTIDKEFVNR